MPTTTFDAIRPGSTGPSTVGRVVLEEHELERDQHERRRRQRDEQVSPQPGGLLAQLPLVADRPAEDHRRPSGAAISVR